MTLPEVTIPHPAMTGRRRWPLWAAAGVTAFNATVHVVAGTPEMLDPLLSSEMDPVPAQTLRVVWHVVSALLATFPLALGWAARATPVAARPDPARPPRIRIRADAGFGMIQKLCAAPTAPSPGTTVSSAPSCRTASGRIQ